MTRRKTLKELTLKDNFMFGAVMCEEKHCKQLLELVLGFPIERVEVSKEKCMVYHPEYKGIRMDVYAKDEKNTRFNVEMQAVRQVALGKRARYYHSQLDLDILTAGMEYPELPNSYVIFICDFDPFGHRKYRYTFRHQCQEHTQTFLKDGSETIFLSTKGENAAEVPKELVKFLKYVSADLEESTGDFEDDFVESLQKSVYEIKKSRGMEERYMLTELLMQDERRAGREEGRKEGRKEGRVEGRKESILEFLSELGTVPNKVQEKIMQENDLNKLREWTKLAARADTVDQFLKEIG